MVAHDYDIGGIKFLAAGSDQFPHRISTVPLRREQLDTMPSVGEQSLDGWWWLRSQTSWHCGAGVEWAEPADEYGQFRFHRSRGVDPWVQGQLSLLPKMVKVPSLSMTGTVVTVPNGVVSVYEDGGVLFLSQTSTRAGVTASTVQPTASDDGLTLDVCSDGQRVWWVTSNGLYQCRADGTLEKTLFLFPGPVTSARIGWVKQRLVLCAGDKVYELPTGDETVLPTALFTQTVPGWEWTAIAESGTAILLSGRAGVSGVVMRVELVADPAGGLPNLSPPITTVVLPDGEWPAAMVVLLGTFLVLGTSKGVRCAVVNGQGAEYGPLLFESAAPVSALASWGRFAWCGVSEMVDGISGLVRVDLGQQIGSGLQFAWATDVCTNTADDIVSVAMLGTSGRPVVTTSGDEVFVASKDELVSDGWVEFSKVRYSTTTPKVWDSVDVECSSVPDGCQIAVLPSGAGMSGDVVFLEGVTSVPLSGSPSSALGLRMILSGDGDKSPVLQAWTLKAFPASQRRQWLYSVPLLCFGSEKDSTGLQWHPGVRSRISALQQMEREGIPVTVRRNGPSGKSWQMRAVVERIEFMRTAPATWGGFDGEDGGVLTVTLRSV